MPPAAFVPYGASEVATSALHSLPLILPSVSVGNVGQLAVDALIASFSAVKVGYLRTPHILPIVAADAAASSPSDVLGRLSLPVELFYAGQPRVLLLQQRAPAVPGADGAYAAVLMRAMEELQVSDVVVLTSASSHFRSDAQIRHDVETLTDSESQEGVVRGFGSDAGHAAPAANSPIHFVSTAAETAAAVAASLQWSLLSRQEPPPSLPPPALDADDDLSDSSAAAPCASALSPLYPFAGWFRGGGVGRYLWPLLEAAASSSARRPLRATALLLYAVEGDNAREALVMAREVDAFLRMGEKGRGAAVELKTPLSWAFVFGREAQQEIYL